jgi:N-acetyl-gamma-glutamyl-phosphate reductase
MTIKAGIYGATGYTGYELVRLLLRHPAAEIAFATSESYAGRRLSDLYPCPYDLPLVRMADAPVTEADVVFLCLPHAASMDAVRQVRAAGVKAIDLSADFRLADPAVYERWYETPHTATELLSEAVYGLPELYRDAIREAGLVANPGCYPTAVLLGLYPLVANGLLERRIIVDAKSGVSGAGRKLGLVAHFVEANENISPYNIGHRHRHISEMEQELNHAGGGAYRVTFSPHLLPVSRGILATMYVTVQAGWEGEQLTALYRETYADECFVHLLPPGKLANLHYVVGTNRCAISLTPADDDGAIIVCAAIDNLLKGASGQAVQNMNLMFGLDEAAGLV